MAPKPVHRKGGAYPLGLAAICAVVLLPLLLAWNSLPSAPLQFWSAVFAWVGTGALAAALLLMIREPAVAAALGGLEHMYQMHHSLGTLSYVLLLTHPLLLAGHALPDFDLAWRSLWPDNSVTAFGWAAIVFMMLGLGATFAMRLPYGIWRKLHMLLGVGALLSVVHIGLATGFEPAVFVIAIAMCTALAWRFARTDLGGGARSYEVSSVTHPADDMVEASLKPLGMPLKIAPGQFVMLAFLNGPHFRGCGKYHPFTASGLSPDGSLTLTIKALGDCTRNIQKLEPGVAARVQGPFGTFFKDRPPSAELWIAGGIGIAPFLARLRAEPVTRETHLVYTYREPSDAAYVDDLQRYASEQPLLHFKPLVVHDDVSALFTELEQIQHLPERQIYVCGPPAMLTALTQWLRQHRVSPKNIHYERLDFR